ncbi:MAG: hypothetical protein ACLUEK_02025 [Oscillospiraceae bacterium]
MKLLDRSIHFYLLGEQAANMVVTSARVMFRLAEGAAVAHEEGEVVLAAELRGRRFTKVD